MTTDVAPETALAVQPAITPAVQPEVKLRQFNEKIRQADAAESEAGHAALYWRWHSGHVLRGFRIGRKLPNGVLKRLCKNLDRSPSELVAWMKFATKYPTEALFTNVVSEFKTWRDIKQKALADKPREKKPSWMDGGLPITPRGVNIWILDGALEMLKPLHKEPIDPSGELPLLSQITDLVGQRMHSAKGPIDEIHPLEQVVRLLETVDADAMTPTDRPYLEWISERVGQLMQAAASSAA